jgi:hypothetical protein
MSLLDYQQLNNSFLDQNLSSLMGPPQQHHPTIGSSKVGDMMGGAPGRFSVQQRPIGGQGNFTPDLIGKFNTSQQIAQMGATN